MFLNLLRTAYIGLIGLASPGKTITTILDYQSVQVVLCFCFTPIDTLVYRRTL